MSGLRSKVLVLSASCLVLSVAYPATEHDYQRTWCEVLGGETEVRLDDRARVDCLTDQYAIEFDFEKKWAECVGQMQYYAYKTGRTPGCVLITKGERNLKFWERLRLSAPEGALLLGVDEE